MNKSVFDKFYLSTEGYYFMYRHDKYDNVIMRATLFNSKTSERVDDVRVSDGYGLIEKTHTDVIDYFEARLLINQ